MDIGKNDLKFGSPVLVTLALLIIIPSSTSYIDCKISCRRCHKNTEHPAVLEVYCAMCKECKQRRRERILGRATKKVKAKAKISPLYRMRDGIVASTDNDGLMMRPQEALQQVKEEEQDYQTQYLDQHEQPIQQPEPLPPPEQLPPEEPEPVPPPESLEPPELLDPPEMVDPPQETQKPPNPKPKALRGTEYPHGCPTAPICSDSDEEPMYQQMSFVNYSNPYEPTARSTTTTTTTATTKKCPPLPKCRKKHEIQSPCMKQCMFPAPLCPCFMFPTGPYMESQTYHPFFQLTQIMPSAPTATTTPSTTNQEYHYVYIGVPKQEMKDLLPSGLY